MRGENLRYTVEFYGCSDIGSVRTVNQDAEGHAILEKGEVYVVCDGIGGYEGGEIASKLAVEAIIKNFPLSIAQHTPAKALEDAISWANQEIKAYSVVNPHYRKMGTTIVVLYLYKGMAYYAHVGDSRIYHINKSGIKQLTKDHSLVQEMVDAGEIEPEMARYHPSRNLITRALGTINPRPDVGKPIRLKIGDKFLLCTDGLTGAFQDQQILELISGLDSQHACKKLVFEANRKDGSDNITVQVIEIHQAQNF